MSTLMKAEFQPKQSRSQSWEDTFQELILYKETHGDCLVPYNYKTNPKLATWVSTQRTQYRLLKNGQKSRMTPSRIAALESVGFYWNLISTSNSVKASPTMLDNADPWSEVKLLHQQSLFWDSNLYLEGNYAVLVDVCEAALTTKKGQPCFFFSKSCFSSCTEETLKAIHKELFLAARRSGFTISKQKSFHEDVRTGWRFICSYGRCHQSTKENQLSNHKDITKKRQSRTSCPVDPFQRCGWSITIRYNHAYKGFVVSACSGKRHSYHMRRTPESISSPKFLTEEDRRQLDIHAECRVSTAATRRVLFRQMGLLLNRDQLRYLRVAEDKKLDSCTDIGNLISKTSAEKLLHDLECIEDIFFIALIDDPTSGLYSLRSKGRPSKKLQLELPDGETYITYLRKALGVHGGTKVLLGVVWTTKEALRYSNAFPERILIDTTYKSNIEQRALFIATGITSCNKTFIALQAYLPNERAWIFQWLYEDAFPTLLGEDFVARNCLLCSDGDPEIYQTFLNVKEKGELWKRSDHILCAFHLINQHFKNEVSSSNDAVRPLWRITKDWMYSWITECETKDEYIYSYRKFERWLRSLCAESTESCPIKIFCKNTLEFVLQKMLPYESRWVRYLRLHNNYFDNITTSAAESSNSITFLE